MQTTFLGAAAAAALVTGAAAEPVSYSRQIAPILAMNCHACHGANPESAAGGLSTRTWADLSKGGNLGLVVVPGAVIIATEDIGAAGPEFPAGEADVRIISKPDEKLVFHRREHVSGGLPALQRWKNGLEPGLYVLHLRYAQERRELAVLFRTGN